MTFQRTRARWARSARIFRCLALLAAARRQSLARSPASMTPGWRPNFRQLCRPARKNARRSGGASAHGDAPHHAIPVMVAAAQIIGSRRAGGEKYIFSFAGLHDDFGAFAVERFRIVELRRGEKDRGGELVGLLAAVFEVQPIVHAMLKVQMVR